MQPKGSSDPMSEETKQQYQDYLQTDYWKLVAGTVKERGGHRCQVCNSSKRLEAHHRTYEHKGNELEHLGDLICLCRNCHGLFHSGVRPRKSRGRLPLAARRASRFFRKSAMKLSIPADILMEKGHAEVQRLLAEKTAIKVAKKLAKRQDHRIRLALFKQRNRQSTSPAWNRMA